MSLIYILQCPQLLKYEDILQSHQRKEKSWEHCTDRVCAVLLQDNPQSDWHWCGWLQDVNGVLTINLLKLQNRHGGSLCLTGIKLSCNYHLVIVRLHSHESTACTGCPLPRHIGINTYKLSNLCCKKFKIKMRNRFFPTKTLVNSAIYQEMKARLAKKIG